MRLSTLRALLATMFVVVVANYLAQVPYYLRLYYFPHHAPPAPLGTLALGVTLAWFLAGWVALWRGGRGRVAGYWLTLAFVLTETGFYVYNTIGGALHGFGLFFHLASPDPVLWAVFATGYLNMLAGLVFIAALVVWRRPLTTPAGAPAVIAA